MYSERENTQNVKDIVLGKVECFSRETLERPLGAIRICSILLIET